MTAICVSFKCVTCFHSFYAWTSRAKQKSRMFLFFGLPERSKFPVITRNSPSFLIRCHLRKTYAIISHALSSHDGFTKQAKNCVLSSSRRSQLPQKLTWDRRKSSVK